MKLVPASPEALAKKLATKPRPALDGREKAAETRALRKAERDKAATDARRTYTKATRLLHKSGICGTDARDAGINLRLDTILKLQGRC